MDSRISYLRILACFMVILLHVAATDFHELDVKWWPANFWDSLTRICVPLFFMISGAGLLTKREPLSTFLRRRFLKILPPLVFWSLFYLGWRAYNGEFSSSPLTSMLSRPQPYPLWYLYALIGLYAFTPILRAFFQNSTNSEKQWFLAACFATSSVLPMFNTVSALPSCSPFEAVDLTNTYSLSYFTGYAGYFVLGAYIYDARVSRIPCIAAFVLLSATTAIATYFVTVNSGQPCPAFYAYGTPNVVLASASFFALFMTLEKREPSKLVETISSCTLGIYCLHMIFLETLLPRMSLITSTPILWVLPPLKAALIFVLCFAIIYAARQIKPLRNVC
jgi:surface polysaccharide O-acyltransferase-like enzyme